MATNKAEMEKLFRMMSKSSASDMHLKVGSPPVFRVNKRLGSLDVPPLSDESVYALVDSIMSDSQRNRFAKTNNAEFAYSIAGIGRYRITVLRQRGCVTVVVRRVSYDIPEFKSLHLPDSMRGIARFDQGLCIVGGPTGSGKSTTLASLLNEINTSRRCHILTVEDPIEYLYRDIKSLVNQREVGIDVASFQDGLTYGLRADPDVILIGEMRDPVTFEIALQAAETGHLVFGTLHVSSAAQTIGRILDLFPAERHAQIRSLLAFNLKGVVVQRLMPGATKAARMVPAVEIMYVNPAIKKFIREAEDERIADVIGGSTQAGMQDFTQSMHGLVKQGLVTEAIALEYAPNPEALQMMLRGISVRSAGGMS